MTTTQLLIAFGKYIAGYRPGQEGWSKEDQEAFDYAIQPEEIVCKYRGRVFTRGVAANGQPIIHYFEDGAEYGLVATEPLDIILNTLKFDIDHRDQARTEKH